MKGTVYTNQRCHICGGKFNLDENRNGLFCQNHQDIKASGAFEVRFGRKIHRRFKEFEVAQTFLLGLRHETMRGTFDLRDYQSTTPLGFATLSEIWLKRKHRDLKRKSYNNLRNYINKAIDVWGQTNIKSIGGIEIEDFLYNQDVSAKTRSNIKSCLHDFWNWAYRREGIRMPAFPETPFKLGWRNIIDIETQQAIIEEVRRISYHINPKIWMGIRWLSIYSMVRPSELLSVTEGQVNTKIPAIIIPDPKGGEPVLVFLHDDDVELIETHPRGLPDLPYFRHGTGLSGVKAGQKFGEKYLYKWWKKACANLGVENVDLYGGTRHSTLTALGEFLSPEEIKRGSLHKTNRALERYLQGRARDAKKVTAKTAEMQKGKIVAFKKRSKNDG